MLQAADQLGLGAKSGKLFSTGVLSCRKQFGATIRLTPA
jgi:hypothetical protein